MTNINLEYLITPINIGDKVDGREYGVLKVNFIKNIGQLSNYHLPWSSLTLGEIEHETFKDYLENLSSDMYVLVDSYTSPIYKTTTNNLLSFLKKQPKLEYDFDIYFYTPDFKQVFVYKGLFDRKIYSST